MKTITKILVGLLLAATVFFSPSIASAETPQVGSSTGATIGGSAGTSLVATGGKLGSSRVDTGWVYRCAYGTAWYDPWNWFNTYQLRCNTVWV